ncbi:MAG TPA: molybdopterin-dependent oxidoreductase, partial [Solirubrobacteraceae bacterium]|nr:molybdopterin-dependent oxidoreductase [Solirubrobacteraceae bacterium]
WGERLTAGDSADHGAQALLSLADALGLADTDGAGLLEIPAHANGRGLREAGVLPNAGPGYGELAGAAGRDAAGIAAGLAAGELSAVYLLHCDPLRDLPDRQAWGEALASASTVVAHASHLTQGIREHADVVFPAEAYPEKEGTVVHPDGRVQRLRPAIAHPGEVRHEWRVLAELAERAGLELTLHSGAAAAELLYASVPFYAGLTLDEIGGRGVRWQERAAATELGAAAPPAPGPGAASASAGEAAAYRSLWDAPEVEFSPTLEFLFPHPELLADDRAASAELLAPELETAS